MKYNTPSIAKGDTLPEIQSPRIKAASRTCVGFNKHQIKRMNHMEEYINKAKSKHEITQLMESINSPREDQDYEPQTY